MLVIIPLVWQHYLDSRSPSCDLKSKQLSGESNSVWPCFAPYSVSGSVCCVLACLLKWKSLQTPQKISKWAHEALTLTCSPIHSASSLYLVTAVSRCQLRQIEGKMILCWQSVSIFWYQQHRRSLCLWKQCWGIFSRCWVVHNSPIHRKLMWTDFKSNYTSHPFNIVLLWVAQFNYVLNTIMISCFQALCNLFCSRVRNRKLVCADILFWLCVCAQHRLIVFQTGIF